MDSLEADWRCTSRFGGGSTHSCIVSRAIIGTDTTFVDRFSASHFKHSVSSRHKKWVSPTTTSSTRTISAKTGNAASKEAGVGRKEALGLGIVVDHRRRNLSEEGKTLNLERLKAYRARLIVFPRKAGKPKKGDSTGDDLKADTTRAPIALPAPFVREAPRKITAEERDFKAYRALRDARADARHAGARRVREKKKEEEEAAKKK
ncbi:hypothetical protein RSAG8_01513, partial [Rhizoctonia solani AG-8 WAC10335]